MRKLFRHMLTVCCMSVACSVTAQIDSLVYEGITQNYTVYKDSLLQHLDKDSIPYGRLYDRVFPFARITDTIGGEGPEKLNFDDFRQAYSEWQRSDYS